MVGFLLTVPLFLLGVVIKLASALSKLMLKLSISEVRDVLGDNGTEKVQQNSVGTKALEGTKAVVRTTAIAGKVTYGATKTAVKATGKALKTGYKVGKVAIKATIELIKLIIHLLYILITFLLGLGVIGVIILVILAIAIIAGIVLLIFWDDMGSASSSSDNSKTVSISNSGKANSSGTTIGKVDLASLDHTNFGNKIIVGSGAGSSKHPKSVKTSVKPSDFKLIADAICSKGNTIKKGGYTASTWVGYLMGSGHGGGSKADQPTYAKNGSLGKISSNSPVYAGLNYKEKEVVLYDCSGFVNWYWATTFYMIDPNNENIEDLAHWFKDTTTPYDTGAMRLKKVKDRADIQGGDIGFNGHHVVIAISNTEVVEAIGTNYGVAKTDRFSQHEFYRVEAIEWGK